MTPHRLVIARMFVVEVLKQRQELQPSLEALWLLFTFRPKPSLDGFLLSGATEVKHNPDSWIIIHAPTVAKNPWPRIDTP